MNLKVVFAALLIALCGLSATDFVSAQNGQTVKSAATRDITIVTEPGAMVWLDEVRRGTTDQNGRLTITKVLARNRRLRIRAIGFAEKGVPLTAATRGEIAVSLTKTTDEIEILFQQAEFAAEGREADKRRAIELYRRVLETKPNFAARAHVGLARVLNDLNEPDQALDEIRAARRINPKLAEASTVEGRIYRKLEDSASAAKAFRRALAESANRQPEAHTGLALALADAGGLNGAVAHYKIALVQLADAEPIVYQLLAETYERMERPQEAITAYEKFLQLDPNSNLAAGVRSIVDRLKKRVKGDTLELLPQ